MKLLVPEKCKILRIRLNFETKNIRSQIGKRNEVAEDYLEKSTKDYPNENHEH